MSNLETFITAAESGDNKTVKSSIASGVDVNASGPNSCAIHCAAFQGHSATVKLLLAADAKTDVADNQGLYPLMLAASKDHSKIVKQLADAGAPLESTNPNGGTALHVAAASGHLKSLKALIAAGAMLDPVESDHRFTPLQLAAEMGQFKIVKALLKAGADVNVKNKYEGTALIRALEDMKYKRVKSWTSEGTNDGRTVRYEIQQSAFWYNGNYTAGSKELGSLMSIKDQKFCASQYWGPEAQLAYLEALDGVKTLIKAGTDLSPKNTFEKTAMLIACHSGEAIAIKALHKAGASFDDTNKDGATALHLAAGAGRSDGLDAVLKLAKNLDVNAVDQFGWTATHYLADIGGTPHMAAALKAAGADFSIKSTGDRGGGLAVGMTPADVATHWNDGNMATLLLPS